MDTVIYTKVLIKNLAILWAIFAVVVIIALHSEKSYIKGKHSRNVSKKFRNDANIWAVISIVAFGYCLYITIPTLIDVFETNYLSAHGELHAYYTKYEEKVWFVADDGEHVSLKLPFGRRSNIPRGECQATICYSERSKYLLDFAPDDDADSGG